MSDPRDLVVHAAVLSGGLCAGFAVYAVGCTGALTEGLSGWARRFTRDLSFIGAEVDGVFVITLQVVALTAVGALSALTRAPVLLSALVPIAVGPHLALQHRRALRTRQLEGQLDGWLTIMASTLMATASLGEALSSSVELLQSPLREEIGRVVAHTSLGTPLDRALESFAERVRSPVVSGALLSLRIARNAGGDLRPVLESAAAALRDMARFEGMVRAKTAEGRAQALAVSIVPAPLVLSVRALSPEFFAPLGRSTAGLLIVAGAAILWLAAIALAAKITTVDV